MPPEQRLEALERRLQGLEAGLQRLADREAICDALYRYCRGIDRCDEEALRAAYWPDATDRHGAYSGSATGFIEQALPRLARGGRMVHSIGNIAIELFGDEAAVESYFQAYQADPPGQAGARSTFLCGRYIDHFSCRPGPQGREWRVLARTVTYDWQQVSDAPTEDEASRFGVRQPRGAARPDDPWYALRARLGRP